MDFNDLTQEERELVAGKTPDEILALAKERGRELRRRGQSHLGRREQRQMGV